MSTFAPAPTSRPPHTDAALEFIFLGTGTSSGLPQVACLTAPPSVPPCRTCTSAETPAGRRNRRRNTSGVVRLKDKHGAMRTIVIDAGKMFQAAALEWFPRYGLRQIDAMLITHAHADAMNGLDDLRSWTLRGAIQPHIDLYVSKETFADVQRGFPYLVAKEFASGGGDVPDFKWHIIEDMVPFEIGDTGIVVTPFSVEHGRVFSSPPAVPVDFSTTTTPPRGNSPPRSAMCGKVPISTGPALLPAPTPYYCFGFKFNNALAYISDVSAIPQDVWSLLESDSVLGALPLLVLDCLHIRPHTSHFGLAQAAACARRVGARKTLLLGFSHEVAHEEWERILPALEGTRPSAAEMDAQGWSAVERDGLQVIEDGAPVWVRAAWDGMRCWVGQQGEVETDE